MSLWGWLCCDDLRAPSPTHPRPIRTMHNLATKVGHAWQANKLLAAYDWKREWKITFNWNETQLKTRRLGRSRRGTNENVSVNVATLCRLASLVNISIDPWQGGKQTRSTFWLEQNVEGQRKRETDRERKIGKQGEVRQRDVLGEALPWCCINLSATDTRRKIQKRVTNTCNAADDDDEDTTKSNIEMRMREMRAMQTKLHTPDSRLKIRDSSWSCSSDSVAAASSPSVCVFVALSPTVSGAAVKEHAAGSVRAKYLCISPCRHRRWLRGAS